MIKAALGVDIGGTSIKLGLVSSQGKLLLRSTFPTESTQGRKKLLGNLVWHIQTLCAEAKKNKIQVLGVGIGAPGPIDVEKGLVYFFPNIPGWKNTALKTLLEARLKMPVFLDNDANAMALGEFTFGAGKGVKNGIALTLGTGVGGGIVMNGKLFHGPSYSAAELGHVTLNEDGPSCGCGSRGCIETYVGNGYFVKEMERRLKSGEKSILNNWVYKEGRELTPLLVAQAARQKDALSIALWKETATHLGTALAGFVNVLNPEKVILGGGIAQNKEFIFKTVRETLKKKAFPIAFRSVKVVPAELGVDAGLIGAAALVLSEFSGGKTV